jgi:hypothetical protein
MKGMEHGWKKCVIIFVPDDISCNGGKSVAKCIMGACAFIAMNAM